MIRTFFRVAGPLFASLLVLSCGGLTGESPHHPYADGGTDDGGSPEGGDGGCDGAASTYHGPPSSPPPGHRAAATACKPSSYPGTDGGIGPACSTDADCGAGEACGCVANGAGRWTGGNTCVAVNCHVDADCPGGNYCVETTSTCGDLAGYYCTTAADECAIWSDCACGDNQCAYSPMVGRRVCFSGTCMG